MTGPEPGERQEGTARCTQPLQNLQKNSRLQLVCGGRCRGAQAGIFHPPPLFFLFCSFFFFLSLILFYSEGARHAGAEGRCAGTGDEWDQDTKKYPLLPSLPHPQLENPTSARPPGAQHRADAKPERGTEHLHAGGPRGGAAEPKASGGSVCP